MKLKTGGVLALSALITIGANDIAGQQGPRNRGDVVMRRGQNVEAIMQMRDRLELTEEQLSALEEIRLESVARQTAARAEMAEIRSQLSAGQIKRSDMMAFMEDRQEANAGVGDQVRERLNGILTETQRGSLEEMGARRQARSSGQARAGRGQGMQGQRGFGGRRGGGMTPGRGFDGPGGDMTPGRGFGRRGDRGFRGARRPGGADGAGQERPEPPVRGDRPGGDRVIP